MELRAELRELRKELNKQIKLLDKELKHQKRTMDVEPVPDALYSVTTMGKDIDNRRVQTKINLLRKVVNHLGGTK